MRPQPQRIGQEFVLGPGDLRTRTTEGGARDPRTLRDRFLLRRFRPEGPRWDLNGDGAHLRVRGGALGTGTLWTRPVALPADHAPELLRLHYMERWNTGGATASRSVVAHLRSEPLVGDVPDLASVRVVLEPPTNEDAWRGRVLDFTELAGDHAHTQRYLTVEIAAGVSAPGVGRLEFAVRNPLMSVTWRFPDRPPVGGRESPRRGEPVRRPRRPGTPESAPEVLAALPLG